MAAEKLLRIWFDLWESGRFRDLPISENFVHISPFGKIEGKNSYLDLVSANEDKFLGYTFIIHDIVTEDMTAVVRYTAQQNNFSLDVSEWHYTEGNQIIKIIAYYHIGDIIQERQLQQAE